MTSNGATITELCKAVVESASDDQLHSGAIALLVSYLFNTVDEDTMKAAHSFAVKAGFDFSLGANA